LPNACILQVQLLAIAIVTAIFPMMSRIGGDERNQADSVKMVDVSVKFLAAAGTWIAIIMIFFSKQILFILGGPLFTIGSSTLIVLCAAIPTLFLQLWGCNYLTSNGRQNQLIYGATLTLAANILLDYLWVPRYGSIGAAYATFMAYLLQCLVILWLINRLNHLSRKIITGLILCGFLIALASAGEAVIRDLSHFKYIIIFTYIIVSGILLTMNQDSIVKQAVTEYVRQKLVRRYTK
jgi:Na+-driven multidrug efflux pump